MRREEICASIVKTIFQSRADSTGASADAQGLASQQVRSNSGPAALRELEQQGFLYDVDSSNSAQSLVPEAFGPLRLKLRLPLAGYVPSVVNAPVDGSYQRTRTFGPLSFDIATVSEPSR